MEIKYLKELSFTDVKEDYYLMDKIRIFALDNGKEPCIFLDGTTFPDDWIEVNERWEYEYGDTLLICREEKRVLTILVKVNRCYYREVMELFAVAKIWVCPPTEKREDFCVVIFELEGDHGYAYLAPKVE